MMPKEPRFSLGGIFSAMVSNRIFGLSGFGLFIDIVLQNATLRQKIFLKVNKSMDEADIFDYWRRGNRIGH